MSGSYTVVSVFDMLPTFKLVQYVIHIANERIIGGDHHGQTVSRRPFEALWRVNATLIQDTVHTVVKELLYNRSGSLEGNGIAGNSILCETHLWTVCLDLNASLRLPPSPKVATQRSIRDLPSGICAFVVLLGNISV